MLLPVSVLLLVHVLFAAADQTCSITRGGTLTQFSGTSLTKIVRTDCNYSMAEFTCNGFRVEMKASSMVEDTGDFTPDILRLKVTRERDGKYRIMTTSDRLIRQNKDRNLVWEDLGGDFPLAHWYDRKRKAASAFKRGVFEVVFKNLADNGDDTELTATCFGDDSFFVSEEASLCGYQFSGVQADVFMYSVLADARLNQMGGMCTGSAKLFQSSNVTDYQRRDAIRNCNGLFVRSKVARCVSEDDKLVADDFENCLRCSLLSESAACEDLQWALSNPSCPPDAIDSFPFLENTDSSSSGSVM